MTETSGDNRPFIPSGTPIAESASRTVNAFDTAPVVTKEFKPTHLTTFATKEEALATMRTTKAVRTELAQAMRESGISETAFVDVTPVIHADHNGAITFSEVQTLVPGAKPLGKEGIGVFGLPKTARKDLQKLFELNIQTWKKKGYVLDVCGSTSRNPSRVKSLARLLLPLFSSENIVVDEEKNVRFIDFADLHPNSGLKRRIAIYSEVAGSYISAGILRAYNTLR
jgi:hypothetical protein